MAGSQEDSFMVKADNVQTMIDELEHDEKVINTMRRTSAQHNYYSSDLSPKSRNPSNANLEVSNESYCKDKTAAFQDPPSMNKTNLVNSSVTNNSNKVSSTYRNSTPNSVPMNLYRTMDSSITNDSKQSETIQYATKQSTE